MRVHQENTADRAATLKRSVDPGALRYSDDGLLPVVVQEVASGALLMLAWADRAAVERTLELGEACFWSRSRQQPWRKGETSGNSLTVVEARVDCDGDALLLRVDPAGPTCHRGNRSCFDPAPVDDPEGTAPPRVGSAASVPAPALELGWLSEVIAARQEAGDTESYTARLLAAGPERIARKIGEEATEVVIAALAQHGEAGPEEPRALVAESADLLYHWLVLLSACGVEPGEIARELRRRHLAPAGPPLPKPEAAS